MLAVLYKDQKKQARNQFYSHIINIRKVKIPYGRNICLEFIFIVAEVPYDQQQRRDGVTRRVVNVVNVVRLGSMIAVEDRDMDRDRDDRITGS